ncbi:MAG: prolyl oligopeptidase family serine peptidase [Ignavibacteriales bacterium]|nr:prolyl oligopeptidase family serine peptidase [Ignavibacteriales bacterium]
MKRIAILALLLLTALALHSQTKYKLPPKEVVDILDASPTPLVTVNPKGDALLLVEYEAHPPIALLARPFLRLAGVRLDPQLNSRQRLTQYTGISVKWFDGGKTVRVELPPSAKVGIPQWSNDGRKIAFTRDVGNGVELWTADAVTGKAAAIPGVRVNDVLGSPFDWAQDNSSLLVKLVPMGSRMAPEEPKVPLGPVVEESYGKVSRVPTYQDLLKDPQDERLFGFFAMSQLALVNTVTGELKPVGAPGIISSVSYSPDERFILVTQLKAPYSYRVPYNLFARKTEVWDPSGNLVATISDLGISDEVPPQGVPTGPRSVEWQALHSATLVWAEALDGGDPTKKVPFRDVLMRFESPFKGSPAEVLKVQHRYSGMEWTANRDKVIYSETDRDRRWRTSSLVDLSKPGDARKVLFDLSMNDAYNDPGRPVMESRADGQRVIAQDGDWIYLSGNGASAQGDRPFLDKYSLATGKKERLSWSDEKGLERFVAFVKASRLSVVTRYESKTEVPNYFIRDMKARSRKALTEFKDPAPQLTGMSKELVKYSRPDGVALSGTLYLPPGYKTGTKLPVLIWAYPLEYSDAGTAGQVRGSPNAFTFFRGPSPLFFVTQGYAVLMDATMPVIGDPETMNNTFVEQIVASAKAAIDKLDSLGVADRSRVLVSGHSYGAFMTANLLAHSDFFAAGIARSGAYNRTLTPFGFQSERRSFWEATDLYMKVSPFTYANKIKKPLLLIHGEADNNTGTFPIQSERMFQAIRGHGGTSRLVLLPFEAHGYSGRESVLHVLAEMFEWGDKYVKNKK